MTSYAFIHCVDGQKKVGIIADKKIVFYKNFSSLVSNIYRGRVEKFIKSLDAYVVDIGLRKKGLLRKKNANRYTKPTDQVIVELTEEKEGEKLYELTEKFSITDGFIVLKNNIYKDENYDFYLRTKGKTLNESKIKSLEDNLKLEFFELKKQINFYPTPKLLRVNTKLKDFINKFEFNVYNNTGLEIENTIVNPYYNDKYNLDIIRGLKEVSCRGINLNGGLELVFDSTEACEVIDINTGSFKDYLNKADMSYKANMDVLDDLARLISIRNIKKMIIIDFLRMDNNSYKIELLRVFKDKLKKYNVKSHIFGFTKMGLFEMIVQ